MKLSELKKELLAFPQSIIRFRLPDGALVEAHAHVTEVARIEKRFIDCGGTLRKTTNCRLQTWVADDVEHRLNAGKLLGILNKASKIIHSEEIEVDIEHELNVITQFPVESIQASEHSILLQLAFRHTACLAPELCLPKESKPNLINILKKNG